MTASRAVRPLRLGPHEVWPSVLLAPMAGITNKAFRQLICRPSSIHMRLSPSPGPTGEYPMWTVAPCHHAGFRSRGSRVR
jgi:tRNA-dihydrouridine synthase